MVVAGSVVVECRDELRPVAGEGLDARDVERAMLLLDGQRDGLTVRSSRRREGRQQGRSTWSA